MKKTYIILIILLIVTISLSSLSSCNDHHYNFDELIDSTKQAFIVEVERTEYYGDISINYLKEIEGEDFDNLLNDITTFEYETSVLLHPKNNSGLSIMLVCNTDRCDYAIMGLHGVEEFKDNKQIYLFNATCNHDDFNKILSKYYSINDVILYD